MKTTATKLMTRNNSKSTRPQPLPRGRVMWAVIETLQEERFTLAHKCAWPYDEICCAVIPAPDKRVAAAIVRFHAMSEGEQRYAIAKEIARVQLGVPSLSDPGFKNMRPARVVECINLADAILALLSRRAKGTSK